MLGDARMGEFLYIIPPVQSALQIVLLDTQCGLYPHYDVEWYEAFSTKRILCDYKARV